MSACPWCREALPVAAAAACPRCEKPLADAAGGRLRPLDVDFEAILAEADAAAALWTKRGAIFAFVLAAIGLVPPVAPFSFVVLVVAQLFWGRFLVSRRYIRHFSPVRRFVTRWLTRLAMILFLLPLHGSVFVPGLGLVASPALFAGICWALGAYFRFHFLREHRREGVLFAEKVFLVLFGFLFVVALVLFGLMAWGVLSILPDGK